MTRRVVVTGASSGIGAACVEAFRSEGAEVLGVDQSGASAADDHLQLDLGQPDCGERLLAFCAGQAIDGLVNNAGIGLNKSAVETSADEFDRVIAVNVRAPLLLASALYPSLADRRGFVVNVASVHAVATSTMVAVYAASKGALVSMTRALALEWAPQVRVNAVLPGAIDTEMLREGLFRTGSSLEDLAARQPVGRVGAPSEIADIVLRVASSQFMTGSSIIIDGGVTARLSSE